VFSRTRRSVIGLARTTLRRILPAPVKRALVRYVAPVEAAFLRVKRSGPQPGALARAVAPFDQSAFAAGPIVHVNNALAWGGAERQLVNTLIGLRARVTRDVVLLCQKLGEDADYDFYRPALRAMGANVRNMAALDAAHERLSKALNKRELNRLAGAFAWMPGDVQERIWRLMSDFAQLKPCAVHAWQDALGIEAAYAAKLIGAPRIIVSTRNLPPTNFAYYRPYMNTAFAELAKCHDVTLLNNSEAGARGYAAWLGIDSKRIGILRNGVDPGGASVLDRGAARAGLGLPEDALVVGSTFRFYDEKRPLLWIDTAIQIAARSDAHFVIFGVGPMLEEVRGRAARAGLADRLLLPGADRDAASKLAAFDVFLLTSAHEGTPNVVLEASAAGVPVVTTAAGGAPEAVLEGVTGFVVAEATPAGLAERVLGALSDEAFRAACAVEGPRFIADRFGIERMLDETLALYALPELVS
jgi:glycosyltransferase involved in cell wall biosynthesis